MMIFLRSIPRFLMWSCLCLWLSTPAISLAQDSMIGPGVQDAQLTFEPGGVRYFDVSADGQNMAYVVDDRGFGALWLRSVNMARGQAPRRIVPEPSDVSFPVFSPNGRYLAYVDSVMDSSGDIFLLDLTQPQQAARRLTPSGSAESGPSFSSDSNILYFHAIDSKGALPTLARINLQNAEAKPEPIAGGIEGSFPSVSPDGSRLAFVSRAKNPGGDIHVLNLASGEASVVTQGPDSDLYPRWTAKGDALVFTRVSAAFSGKGIVPQGNPILFYARVEQGAESIPLSSFRYSAWGPVVAGTDLYALSSQSGAANVHRVSATLGMEDVPAADLLRFAANEELKPDMDPGRVVVLYSRVWASSRATDSERAKALSGAANVLLDAGRRYQALLCWQKAGQLAGADAEIHSLARVNAAWLENDRSLALASTLDRPALLGKVEQGMTQLAASETLPDPVMLGHIRLASLLADYGTGISGIEVALNYLDAANGIAGGSEEYKAEAAILRADLFGRLGRSDELVPMYAAVVREFPKQERVADVAVSRLLDTAMSGADDDVEKRSFVLRKVVERFGKDLPRIAAGALNRMGDIYYAANRWESARTAYREVLDNYPATGTQIAAARMSLAEVFYREERFSRALELYEKEMSGRAPQDRIYLLAREAYLRKSSDAGIHLVRTGEVPAALSLFADLRRYDPSYVPAHRGYILARAALGEAAQVVAEYRNLYAATPDDPVLRYSLGLALTWLETKPAMVEAGDLIAEAIDVRGQEAWFHQTMGYVHEALGTAFGVPDELEPALESYRKAWFLTDRARDVRRNADLSLNLGNANFLLGRFGAAFERYQERLNARVPFQSADAELLFYRRLGMSAFRAGVSVEAVPALEKAMALAAERARPERAAESLGEVARLVRSQIIRPALEKPEFKTSATRLEAEQADITAALFEAASSRVQPPPSEEWPAFQARLKALLERQRKLNSALRPLMEGDTSSALTVKLVTERAAEALDDPVLLQEMRAELSDRLGLAYQENGQYEQARAAFAAAFDLNRGLGKLANLAVNKRSMGYCDWLAAGETMGDERIKLLHRADVEFREVLSLVDAHGVPERDRNEPKGGLINLAIQVSADDTTATSALYGFSAPQEKALAETFIARISTELGAIEDAAVSMESRLAAYEGRDVSDKDAYGVSLLYHRAAQLDFASGRYERAFTRFRKSGELALRLKNTASASINAMNMARSITFMPRAEWAAHIQPMLAMDRRVTRGLIAEPGLGDGLLAPEYHNTLAALILSVNEGRVSVASAMAGQHLHRALALLKKVRLSRKTQALQSAILLNLARLESEFGADAKSRYEAALVTAQQGLLPQYEWRALAKLGRYDEAFDALQQVPITSMDCGPGEVVRSFAPLVRGRLESEGAEAAYNLLEQLSELERVNRTAPLVLRQLSPLTQALLRRTGPRLIRLAALRGQEDNEKVRFAIQQEEEILDRELGAERERLPMAAGLARDGVVRDHVLALMGLALRVELAADRASQQPENGALREIYERELAVYGAAVSAAKSSLPYDKAPGVLGYVVPVPAEAVDIMDCLMDGGALRYAVQEMGGEFVVSMDGVEFVSGESVPGGDDLVAGREDDRASQVASGSHFFRSFNERKPFRKRLLLLASDVPDVAGYTVSRGSLSMPEADLNSLLAQARTVQFGGAVASGMTLPVRSGDRAQPALWAVGDGVRRELPRLAAQMGGSALLMIGKPVSGGAAQAVFVADVLSLQGVPTVVVPDGNGSAHTFLESYVEKSPAQAASASGKWLRLGARGLDSEQAASLARERFDSYLARANEAFDAGRWLASLDSYDGVIEIAEALGGDFAVSLPDVYATANTAAFNAKEYGRAAGYAEKLVAWADKSGTDVEKATALMMFGAAEAERQHFGTAIPAMRRAVDIIAESGSVADHAKALAQLGVVMENHANYGAVLGIFSRAADLSDEAQDDSLLARMYMRMGRVLDLRLDRWAEARNTYAEAYEIYAAIGDDLGVAQALLDMGRCDRLAGLLGAASGKYAEAYDIADGMGDTQLLASVMLEQANNAWFKAEYQDAFDLVRRVLSLAEKHDLSLTRALATNTAGLLWWTLGDNDRALRELNEALELMEGNMLRRDVYASILNNIALVRRENGDFDAAMATLEKALAIDEKSGSRWAMAYDYKNMGMTLSRRGDFKGAVAPLEKALELTREIGNRINEAKVLVALGEVREAAGQNAEAVQVWNEALELSERMGLREMTWRSLYGLGRQAMSIGEQEKALGLLSQAVNIVEGMRAEIRLQQLRDGFAAGKSDVYETLARLQADMGNSADAFYTAERSRARNLIDLLGNRKRSLRGGLDQGRYNRVLELRARIQEQDGLVARAESDAERETYAQGKARLVDEYDDLILEIQADNPELAGLVSVNPMRLTEVEQTLPRGVALLAYYLSGDEVFCWTVRKEGSVLTRTSVDRAAFGNEVLSYRRMLQNLDPVQTRSQRIYDVLVRPVETTLQGASVVGVVPYGPMHYLSFATLDSGRDYFIDQAPLFYLPSASVMKYTFARRQSAPGLKVLAVGNPDLGNSAMALPFSEHEVSSISWNYPDVTVLTGEKARKDWISEHIGEYGIIHFAAHGEFDRINPLFSAILFAHGDSGNGRLAADEVFDLDIRADLVVLSACQTGLGKLGPGDDVAGLNQSFLFAGTHAVVSSLWRISDVSTAILMKDFYREYVRQNKAASLREAMLHVRTQYPHPGFWGGFILVGDYE